MTKEEYLIEDERNVRRVLLSDLPLLLLVIQIRFHLTSEELYIDDHVR